MSPTLDHIADIPAYIFGQSSQRVCPSPTTQVVLEGAEHSLGFYISLFVVLVTYIFWINYWSAQGANHKTLFSFLGYQRGDYTAKLGGLNPQFKGYIHIVGELGGNSTT